MAKYFALHTLKKSGEEVSDALNAGAAEMAKAMASGQTPARCVKTWSPIPHGREDYSFCVWEADSENDVKSTIESFGLLEYFTLDAMQVDEIDWAELAK
ncbi:MAG: hypothetical protein ACK2VA_20080 [Anaerolineae bacterium]|jgi:hypothetical protein